MTDKRKADAFTFYLTMPDYDDVTPYAAMFTELGRVFDNPKTESLKAGDEISAEWTETTGWKVKRTRTSKITI